MILNRVSDQFQPDFMSILNDFVQQDKYGMILLVKSLKSQF